MYTLSAKIRINFRKGHGILSGLHKKVLILSARKTKQLLSMEKLKKCLPDLLAVVLFAVIAFAYFFPADFEGRILYQHDTSAGRGAGQEALEYYQSTGERTRWTNSTFSGMPTYQTAPSYDSTDILSQAVDAWHLWLPDNVWYVFAYLLGFYVLLRAFNFRQTLAVLGAIAWAFSSYFFIIIGAGHIWKVWALAYLPPMIAGVVLAYRGKYFWGFVVTAVFAAFEVNANHVQMTYYYLFISFPCRGHTRAPDVQVSQGFGSVCRRSSDRHLCQPLQSVSYMAVSERVDEGKKRTGQGRQCQSDR